MFKIIAVVITLFSPLIVFADCSGKPIRVQLTHSGAVELISKDVYGDTTGRVLCNMSTEWKGVKTESCKGWYSLILASIAQNSSIKIQQQSGESCSQQGSWSAANPPHMISNE